MKYCARFSNKINLTDFDEISILYNKQDRELIPFLQKHLTQKVILVVIDTVDFYNSQEWLKLNAIHEQYPELNFSVCFKEFCLFEPINNELELCFKNLNVPYFTGDKATNFDQLCYLGEHGVSDIYVAEGIGFDLKRAKLIASNYGAQLRAFPNVAQGSVRQMPALKKFFIRPEDVEEYSNCIDVLEFWGPLDRQETLLRIYKKGAWYGDLKELILDFDLSLDSRCIVSTFGKVRKSCDRKCIKGDSCAACDKVLKIG